MRTRVPQQRMIPSNATEVRRDDLNAIAYLHNAQNGKPAVKAYAGKSNKPALNYWYHTPASRDKAIADFFAGLEAHAQMLTERKAKREQPNKLQVGDILVYTWGYEQTNVQFFQVKEVKGQSVVIHEIAAQTVNGEEGGGMCDHCTAVKDAFLADEPDLRKKVIYGDNVTLASYGYCHKWDGMPKYRSWYA